MNKEPQCKDCKYWKGYAAEWEEPQIVEGTNVWIRRGHPVNFGKCHFNPPVIENKCVNEASADMGVWPITLENSFCGKYEAK